MQVIIINGPNLNLTGIRQQQIYGYESFETFFKKLHAQFPELNLSCYQNNVEGEIINKLHETGFTHNYILLNAGGYTHTSVAIADAVAAIKTPVIEIHMSNIYSRETYRRHSLLSEFCMGIICGFGLHSYTMALNFISQIQKQD